MDNDGWSKIHQVCMEIWNSKSGGNIYSDFEATFGVLFEVHFWKTIYHFKALEVRNPILQIVYKSRLKQGTYACLKQTDQRGKLSSKLTTYIRNDFLSFKTQKNVRKLFAEAKLYSYYLFQARGMQLELKNMEFLDG